MNKEEFDKIKVPGSIHWSDAEVIRETIQKYDPDKILELGCFMGTSTLVIIDAMRKRIWDFDFTSVDIKAPGELYNIKDVKKAKRSELVPENAPVELITSDAIEYLQGLSDESIDFIFEDTNHQVIYTANLIPEILRVLKPNGVALFHNLNLTTMKAAFKKAGMKKKVKEFPPSWMGMLRKENGVLV